MKPITHAISGLMIAIASATTHAQLFVYDSINAELGIFDPVAPNYTLIAPLSTPDGTIADLEFHDGKLFALESAYPNGGWLIELSPIDGSILNRNQITLNGLPAINALDALASYGNNLYISYWDNAVFPAQSNILSPIDENGVIENTSLATGISDADGMCAMQGGGIWFVDRDPQTDASYLRTASNPTINPSTIASYPFDAIVQGFGDLTDDGDSLYVVDPITDVLHHLDRDTYAITTSTPYPSGKHFRAIAYRSNRCNAADLAAPFGTLNFFDVGAFLNAYNAQEGPADLANPPGVWNFFDVTAFLSAYMSGCP